MDPRGQARAARSVGVFGVSHGPDPGQLDALLGQCEQLRIWARAQGFELDGVPDDLVLLDQAFDQSIDLARSELGGPLRNAALGSEAGLFLGTVIITAVPGSRWRLWPNGHPVVRLPSGRDLDVVALAHDRMNRGTPLLAEVYADAAAVPPR